VPDEESLGDIVAAVNTAVASTSLSTSMQAVAADPNTPVSVSVLSEGSTTTAESKKDINVGAIVGGTIAALVVVVVAAIFIRQRSQSRVKGWDWETAAAASSESAKVGESEI
jgi:hypothetical protein